MKTARKIAAWLLCFSMLISNVTVYAEDILSAPENNDLMIQEEIFSETEGETQLQDDNLQEEDSWESPQEDSQEENLQDENNVQSETEESRFPADLSENKDIIYQIIYMEQTDSLLEQKIGLDLSFQNALIEQGIKAEDTLFFFVPEEYMTVDDTGEPVPVYDKNSKLQVGEYTVTDNKVRVEFLQDMEDLSSFVAELELEVTCREDILAEEPQTYPWKIQKYGDGTYQEVLLTLPAKVMEPGDILDAGDILDSGVTQELSAGSDPVSIISPEELWDRAGDSFTDEETGFTFTVTDRHSEEIQRDIFWIDNNNSGRKRPAASEVPLILAGGITFTSSYTYKDTEGQTVTNTVTVPFSALGITEDKVSYMEMGGTGHDVYTILPNALPTKAKLRGEGVQANQTVNLSWNIAPCEISSPNYGLTEVTDDNIGEHPGATIPGWYYTVKMDYDMKVQVRRGNTRMYGIYKKILDSYDFHWETGVQKPGEGEDINKGSLPLNSPELPDVEWTFHYDTVPGTAEFSMKGLLRYNLDGSEITYKIEHNKEKMPNRAIEELIAAEDGGVKPPADIAGTDLLPGGDRLEETIENNLVSNHGENTDAVYSGGTLILTLTGERGYTATKEWYDSADSSHRPEVDFYLWRVTDTVTGNPEDKTDVSLLYQTAAAVKDKNGKTAVFTIPENSTGRSHTINFSDIFEMPEGRDGYLPKYDSHGYPYRYLTREYMEGENAQRYRVVYGKLDMETGKFEDVLPSWDERDKNDNSIYDGGTVSNLLTGTTFVSVEKIWNAMAFQSELYDVKVEFTLQRRLKGTDDPWENTGDTKILENFIAEQLTRSFTKEMPRYDKYGREIAYRWEETAVYQGDSKENCLDVETGKITLHQKGMDVVYTSVSRSEEKDGVFVTTVQNNLEDKTEYRVTKTWEDGLLPEPISFWMYRFEHEDKKIKLVTEENGPFIMDGQPDETPQKLYVDGKPDKVAGYVQEKRSWYAEFWGMDLYGEEGHPYEYMVMEETGEKWQSFYDDVTDEDGIKHMNIKNVPLPPEGEGNGYKIYLKKIWRDDGDAQHRETVTYTLYQRTDEGKFEKTDKEYKISAKDNWWVEVPGVKIPKEQLLILETKVGNTEISYTPDDMEAIFKVQHGEQGVSTPYIKYNTQNHRYEVSYSSEDIGGIHFYTATNRRLGSVNIDAKKKWVDGKNSDNVRTKLFDSLEKKGYELVLKLECSQSDAIDYVNNTIKVRNVPRYIMDKEGGKGSAIQVITGNEEAQEFSFYNLPKYDRYGHLLSYTLKEMARKKGTTGEVGLIPVEEALKGEKNVPVYKPDITSSYTPEHGLDGADKLNITLTNKISGEKEVYFLKEWKDAYRYEMGERPDIYLDLYELRHVEKDGKITEELVPNYKDRKWTFYEENDDVSMCSFGKMPKYDELGYEITYYAQEKMKTDKEFFDYKDVYYKYLNGAVPGTPIEQYIEIGDEKGFLISDESYKTALYKNTDGVYLLKEKGVFVNQIAESVFISGKKIWANMPAGFPDEELPGMEFKLYQYLEGDKIPEGEIKDRTPIATLKVKNWKEQYSEGEYRFGIKFQGENKNVVIDDKLIVSPQDEGKEELLPQYNEDGKRYTYVLREETLKNFGDTDAGHDADGDKDEGIKLVYKQPSIHNYAVTNGYLKDQKGILKVRKWVDRKEPMEYVGPGVSFTLTREYKKSDGSWVKDTAFSEIKYLNYKDFEDDRMGEVTFENLAIYAPNGNKYEYTITENANGFIQGGYEVAGGTGLLGENDEFIFDEEITGLYPIKKVEGEKPQWNTNSSVTYKNTYTDKDKVPLTLRKWWNDRHNFAGLRGKSLTLDFYRRADAQSSKPEDNNEIKEEKLGTVKLTVPDSVWYEEFYDKAASSDKRKKEVKITGEYLEGSEKLKKILGEDPNVTITAATSNLAGQNKGDNGQWDITFDSKFEIYAPNGMPWIYRLDEQVEEPYVVKETEGRDFYYDKGKNCFTSGTGNSFTNALEVTRAEIYKYTKDSENLSKPLTNRTGYKIQLTAKLYVAATENPDERDKLTNWKCVEDSEYGPQIDAFSNQRNPDTEQGASRWNKFSAQWTFGKSDMMGADGNGTHSYYRCHDLPVKIKTEDNKIVYFRYAFVETGLEFKDESGQTVYQEEFELNTEIVKDEYDGNKEKVGYWLKPTAKIRKGNELVSTEEIWFRPLFDEKQKLIDFCSKKSTFRQELKDKRFPLDNSFAEPFLATKTPDGIVGQTERNDMYNLVDAKRLYFEKIWVNDNHNEFGTRVPADTNTWEVSFMIQRKDKDQELWENCPESVYKPNPVKLSGQNDQDSAGMDIEDLPAQSLVKTADGSYEFVEYDYRAREVDTDKDKTVIGDSGTYNEAYQAKSEDLTLEEIQNSDAKDADYYSRVTNTMEVTEQFAEKRWDDKELTAPVTFELQYQLEKDNSWVSFKIPAKVVLDGKADEEKSAYLEYEPWKAKWSGVPKTMPGSVKDNDGNTIYRIVEIADSSYETTEGTEGSGTEEAPYILKDMDPKATQDAPAVYRNSLTELKVEKRIDRPEGADLSPDEKAKEFTFTIDGLTPGKTYSYRKYTKADSTDGQDVQKGETSALTSEQNTFTLKDSQYVIIYGLEKGKTYTVKETAAEGYEVSYVTSGKENKPFGEESESSGVQKVTGEITIPEEKPDTALTITAVNKRLGMIVIEKKTGEGKPLDGVVFELQYKTKDGDYKPVDETVCRNPLIVNPPADSGLKQGQVKTGAVTVHDEEKKGCAVFDKMMLGYDYRIVEVSVPQGYNKLDKPVEISLPYETSEENQTGKIKPIYEMEGKYYYAEITLLIENNTGITMPLTSGSGFFLPGIIGVLLVGAAGIWYVIREEKKRKETKK